jgi:hypothetical protein
VLVLSVMAELGPESVLVLSVVIAELGAESVPVVLSVAIVELDTEDDASSAKAKFELASARPAVATNAKNNFDMGSSKLDGA